MQPLRWIAILRSGKMSVFKDFCFEDNEELLPNGVLVLYAIRLFL
jgi:hypothetical protein